MPSPDLGDNYLDTHRGQSLSDCEDDSAEGAALNLVTQGISRLGQRESRDPAIRNTA